MPHSNTGLSPFTFINRHLTMGSVYLFSTQRQFFLLLGQMPTFLPPCSLPLLLLPLIPSPMPLRQLKLLCSENLVVRVLSQYFPFLKQDCTTALILLYKNSVYRKAVQMTKNHWET